MAESQLTDEFSICLLLDTPGAATVNELRQKLPASPYRDDRPHVTLLRGIHAPTVQTDEDLLEALSSLLKPSEILPQQAKIRKVVNRLSYLYRLSSVAPLTPSQPLKSYRKQVVRNLKQAGYHIEFHETLFYYPHITIRLGVPVRGKLRSVARAALPSGTKLTFASWVVFRIMKDGKKRLVRVLEP